MPSSPTVIGLGLNYGDKQDSFVSFRADPGEAVGDSCLNVGDFHRSCHNGTKQMDTLIDLSTHPISRRESSIIDQHQEGLETEDAWSRCRTAHTRAGRGRKGSASMRVGNED